MTRKRQKMTMTKDEYEREAVEPNKAIRRSAAKTHTTTATNTHTHTIHTHTQPPTHTHTHIKSIKL